MAAKISTAEIAEKCRRDRREVPMRRGLIIIIRTATLRPDRVLMRVGLESIR
jgi:hypothetical protein